MATLPRERESHVSKVDELKKSARLSSEPLQPDATISPVDQVYRERAGEVRRRDDRTMRAEPPPTRRTEAATSCRYEPNRGRKKRTSEFDGDDGSDSERDNPTGFGGGDGDVVRRKKNRPLSAPDKDHDVKMKSTATDHSASMLLTPEEEQRVKLRRQINRQQRADEDGWRRLLDARSANKKLTEKCKACLLRLARERTMSVPAPTSTDPEMVRGRTFAFQLQQSRMDRYLDENLYHNISEINLMDGNNYLFKGISKRDLLEGIINQAESDFILWWRQFVETRDDTILSIVKSIWENGACILKFLQHSRDLVLGDERDQLFFIYYGRSIFHLLEASFLLDPGLTEGERIQKWRIEGPVETAYFNTIAMLSESQLRQKYLDWVCSDIPNYLITYSCQKMLHQIGGRKIREVLGPSSTSQEFVQNVEGEGTLSLLLFKGGVLISIKPVPPHDCQRLGLYHTPSNSKTWCGSAGRSNGLLLGSTSAYHRFVFDTTLGHFFQVGVDGELLGV